MLGIVIHLRSASRTNRAFAASAPMAASGRRAFQESSFPFGTETYEFWPYRVRTPWVKSVSSLGIPRRKHHHMHMKLSRWRNLSVWFIGVCASVYLGVIILIGPPYLARQHPFTWSLDFQKNVERLVAQHPTEEAFIKALQARGFRIRIPPQNPVTYWKNGVGSISYVDRERTYTTYPEFLQAHERFQSALPENYVEHPRSAETGYGFLVCGHGFSVAWHLVEGKIVDLKAVDQWDCL